MRILIVDDEPAFAETLQRALRRLEADWEIDCSIDAEQAAAFALARPYDVIVLDWELGHPKITGLTICRHLRSNACDSAIVFLTFRDSAADRIDAIRAGADDHVVKRFGLEEIHARIKVAGKRGPIGRRFLNCGALNIDVDRQQLLASGEVIELTKHQWLLVSRLARSPGIPVKTAELSHIAGIEPGDGYKNLRNEVHRLRRRLEEHQCGAAAIIQHIRGVGYVLRESAELPRRPQK